MDEYLAHFRVLENALADCEHLLLHSAAQSATCPSPRSPAGCVTCWPARASRCRRPYARPATRMRSCGSSWRPAPPGRPDRGRNLPAGGPRRRGRPALPWHPEPAARPGLGQHHRRRVPGGDQGLPGPPVPAPDGPGPADHGTARRPGPARADPDPHLAGRPAARGAARGVRRGGQYPGRHPHRPPGRPAPSATPAPPGTSSPPPAPTPAPPA